MKKAIYKPTNQNTIIINEFDAYCEILLLEGEYVNVLRSDIEFFEPHAKSSLLKERKENIFPQTFWCERQCLPAFIQNIF